MILILSLVTLTRLLNSSAQTKTKTKQQRQVESALPVLDHDLLPYPCYIWYSPSQNYRKGKCQTVGIQSSTVGNTAQTALNRFIFVSPDSSSIGGPRRTFSPLPCVNMSLMPLFTTVTSLGEAFQYAARQAGMIN